MKGLLRSAAGLGLAATGQLRRGLRRTGVIVAFHRVNDRTAGDALTRSRRDYERFCRFFRTHFDVVALSEIVSRLERDESVEGLLAITHDDGYLDNYEHAAPILQKLGLPATFFVTTRFLGSDTVPVWDEHLQQRLAWMTWDHLHELSSAGIDIGSHTCSHADLGRVTGEEAQRELTESRRELERELGRTVDLFAYPFGGAKNMLPENVKCVRQAGYRCCLSCYGGLAPDGTDPFELPRVPISMWYQTPSQLALALGLKRA
ncbi:MAG TPA: polysaccharide deacetylase family protein [Myxococcota bacterium]|nr:polysaccharide deacetylase family protein [Myxococcota bacterium]